MFNNIRNNVCAALDGRFLVSEIVKEEEYFVFGIFGKQGYNYDYVIVLLDGDTININNGGDSVKLQFNINDENVADIVVKLMCELNLTFL